jgi:hypothetical protein
MNNNISGSMGARKPPLGHETNMSRAMKTQIRTYPGHELEILGSVGLTLYGMLVLGVAGHET